MSVLIETTLGDLVIDLHLAECPRTSLNFLKLCKVKYYNFAPFHHVQKNFVIQTGDPTGTGSGGESVWGLIRGSANRYFPAEVHPRLKHRAVGTVAMALAAKPGEDVTVADIDWSLTTGPQGDGGGDQLHGGPPCGSQFFITTGPDLTYLDGKYSVFGQVVEGLDVLEQINSAPCDAEGRPFRDLRILHTIVLDDPYPDPPGLPMPDRSPLPTARQLASMRLLDSELREEGTPGHSDDAAADKALREAEATRMRQAREAEAQALTLEMIGDLPFAEIRPPENVLFVCKLNPVTTDEDLELIFSRFGQIISCQVIRDRKTNDSLGYAFIEFAERADCERAYFKMDSVLIDDRRIRVDFSQSVSKLHGQWVDGQVRQAGRRGGGHQGLRSKQSSSRSRDALSPKRSARSPSPGSRRHRASRRPSPRPLSRSRSPGRSRRIERQSDRARNRDGRFDRRGSPRSRQNGSRERYPVPRDRRDQRSPSRERYRRSLDHRQDRRRDRQ